MKQKHKNVSGYIYQFSQLTNSLKIILQFGNPYKKRLHKEILIINNQILKQNKMLNKCKKNLALTTIYFTQNEINT